ncbi:RNA polymerase sigma-70 factor (family 1) [Pedobacter africanus]|uniref:RNA polymerase sigma-70 factor (ECF subfamily) n=1 Tax=Pedobacter africanus TaxID=151894 RepID=A0ACC6L0V3_9SPHI|nr:RNA polymerase sigma-70 factor [Pedobacter africanus]MDR6785263.1 RNA polymerase sigma-70 factor (ECF subfamily) [Pedobacter africanus]
MAAYSTYTDQELLALLKQGNDAAFTEIYDRFSGPLYVFAFRKLKNEDEAKDVVQEIFIVLWNRHAELDFHSSLSAYLFKAVHNRALNLFVHQRYHETYISSFEAYLNTYAKDADELLMEKELAAIIDQEIALLPEKMREIFLLSRKEQLSHKEVAERLGISELTVKTQIKRALKVLRLRLGLMIYLAYLLG